MNGVLVTGATSPFGRALVRRLLTEPDTGNILAVGGERDPIGLPLAHPRLTYVKTDLTRYRRVSELLYGPARELGVEAIVHSPLDGGIRGKGERLRALDVGATRALVLLAEQNPAIRRLVYRSFAETYRIEQAEPNLLDEDAPFELGSSPQRVRDRVEADLMVCTRMGMTPVHAVVLRCAEILAEGAGSQIWDYLKSRVCFRPLGFDPMINLLSLDDAVRATSLALRCPGQGAFNIPGADTLPLSRLIRRWGRLDIPVPGPLLAPLYRMRTWTIGLEFRYDLNMTRFHFGGILDGSRARDELGYEPRVPITWPTPAPAPAPAQR